MSWMATEWSLTPEPTDGIPPVTIHRVRGLKGIRYAVRQGCECLSKDGEWDFEPMPSSRTDEWLDRHRFDTWEQAAQAVERYVTSPWGLFEQYRPQQTATTNP